MTEPVVVFDAEGTRAYASAVCLREHIIGGYQVSEIGWTSLCETCIAAACRGAPATGRVLEGERACS